MSATIIRHADATVSFIPMRRERQLGKAVRAIRTRVSRRRLKRAARALMSRVEF